ncbi:MAG: hypothetical protein OEW08_13355, partial [Gammaproteobacteria bacterium]|nr:hypothetical protein [Gammaproteobacteria bacterium]
IAGVTLFAGILVACGGGSSGDGTPPSTELPVAASTAFYRFYLGANKQLFAVDPTHPSAGSIEVKASGTSLSILKYHWLRHAKFNSDELSDIHYPWLVVHSQTTGAGIGNLYRINTLVSAGTPVANKLSTLSDIEICGQDAISDFANSSQSVYLFRTPNTGNCAGTDLSWKAVKMDADSNTTATSAFKVVQGIRSETGEITGFLVKRNNVLQQMDAQFSVASAVVLKDNNIQNIPLGTPERMSPNINGVYLFSTDNAGQPYVYGFDTKLSKLTKGGAPLYHYETVQSAATFLAHGAVNTDYRFFDDGPSIIRLHRDGTSAATVFVSNIESRVQSMAWTDNHLVYFNGNGDVYKILQGNNGTVAETSLTPMVDTSVANIYTSGAWIFYTTIADNAGIFTYTAHYIREDGLGHGFFDGKYSAAPQNKLGALWVTTLYGNARNDEVRYAKGDLVLFMASADTKNAFYKVVPGSSTPSSAVLEFDVSVNILENQFQGDDFEGDYTLLSVFGGTGTIYVINAATGTSARVDDGIPNSGDEAFSILNLQ